MRVSQGPGYVTVSLSARETSDWARGEWGTGRWPCSDLAGKRVWATFDGPGGDLVDMAVNGGRGDQDVAGDEFNAIFHDALKRRGLL